MSKRLYVGNLPYSMTSEQLEQLFAQYGNIDDATVVTDRETGRSRGFGFVEMTDPAEADQAIAALNGTEQMGRTLRVSEAHPRPRRERW